MGNWFDSRGIWFFRFFRHFSGRALNSRQFSLQAATGRMSPKVETQHGRRMDFLRHSSGVQTVQKAAPGCIRDRRGPATPLAHRRPGYPLSGCFPAAAGHKCPNDREELGSSILCLIGDGSWRPSSTWCFVPASQPGPGSLLENDIGGSPNGVDPV